MRELYELIGRGPDFNIKVSCYMLELYNDQLVDLLTDKVLRVLKRVEASSSDPRWK